MEHMSPDNAAWPKVAIIILNWNGWRDTLECLKSVERLTYPNYEVVLVDNGSVDDSVARIRDWVMGRLDRWGPVVDTGTSFDGMLPVQAPAQARVVLKTGRLNLIRSDVNLGFAGGCNLGISLGLLDPRVAYFYLLNNDARVTPGAILEAVAVAERFGSSLVGSVIWERPQGRLSFAGSDCFMELFLPSLSRTMFRIKAKRSRGILQASMVPGSAMLLSRQLVQERIDAVGYIFNPCLYLYGEELELCIWAQRAGFQGIIALQSIVYHPLDKQDMAKIVRMQYYLTRNLIFIVSIHFPAYVKCAFYVWHIIFRSLLAMRFCIAGKLEVAMSVIRGLKDGLSMLNNFARMEDV